MLYTLLVLCGEKEFIDNRMFHSATAFTTEDSRGGCLAEYVNSITIVK